MMTYEELVRKVEKVQEDVLRLADLIHKQTQKVQGDGVIVLSGNRFKIDRSGSISEYKRKTDS